MIDYYGIRYEAVQRTAFCRGCDKTLLKGEKIIKTYSFRNTGMHILLCNDCVLKMAKMVKENK